MKLITLLSFFLFIQLGYSQKADLSQETIASINARIEAEINPSIAIGIIDKDGIRYYSFGSKTMGGESVDEHTIYEIGSISKTFTGILLGQMVMDGKMKLDDPVEKYLPSAVKVPSRNGQKITLGHLSDHTSALPRLPDNMNPADASNPYADYTVEQMYAFLSGYELTRDIGSEYEYSNYAQGLLGNLLGQNAGKSYEQLMIDNIAKPLGMTETKITFDQNMLDHLAIGHAQGKEVSNWDLSTMAGAGAIRSSIHDMMIYLGANLGLIETDLKPAIDLSHTPRHDKADGSSVGLAWHIVTAPNGSEFIFHNGGTGGYSTIVGFSKEMGKGVAVFTNSTEGVDDIGRHIMNPESDLNSVKPRIATEMRKAIDEGGVEKAVARYQDLETNHGDEYNFDEDDMNALGYYYMSEKNIDAALAIFKVNMESHPKSANVYDSYAEGLMEDKQNDLSIEYYKKSLELNPANQNAVDMLSKMGVEYEIKVKTLSEDVLAEYVGKYQLAPAFHIEITNDGTQLFGQATGQPKFELFASNEDEFYLKVVEARIVFSRDDEKQVKSMTLFQGGQEMPGQKME